MKKTITLFIALLISISSFAQTGINYKAVIKDINGSVVANQNIDVRFTIEFNDIEFGITTGYREIQNTTTDANGIIVLNIGEGTVLFGSFPESSWYDESYLTVEIDIEMDGTFVILPTTEINDVPTAKKARFADTASQASFASTANFANSAAIANNVSGLEQITEGGFTGWRLIGRNPVNYGNIGSDAVDLSFSVNNSTERGATGSNSTAMGSSTTASGLSSTALGKATVASGNASTAMGSGTTASGRNSTSMGAVTIASGWDSATMGWNTLAESFRSLAIGSGNIGGGDPNTWVPEDPLFEIGNSTNSNNRSNALTVLKNGKIGIGRATPSSLLEIAHPNNPPTASDYSNAFSIHNQATGSSWQFHTVANSHLSLYRNGSYRGFFNEATGAYSSISDRKTKKDIKPIENGTLNKVMQLNPVSYLMKEQTDTKRNLGLISQEVQELFPSITNYVEESDLLALSYTELIPILIKALQEQQAIIDKQHSKIETITKDLTALQSIETRLNQLESILKTPQQ